MYERYRQANLATLQTEAAQLAQMYADEYDAAERLARWHPEQYDSLVARAADAYQAKMATLQASVMEQAVYAELARLLGRVAAGGG